MNVDDLIDRVARDLTAGEPPAALSREVRTRIAALPRRRPWPWWAAPAAGLVAAAVVLLAIALPRPQSQPPAVPRPANAQIASGARTDLVSTPLESTPAAPARSPRRPRRSSTPAPNPVLAAWQERAVTALPGVQPLLIDRIQPSDLSIPLMEVEPLGTAPLSVPAGSSSGG